MKTRLYCIVAVIFMALAPASSRAQATRPSISAVVRIGMTVEDMDRSLDFYTRVLDFQKSSDVEVAGEPCEKLFGVFGMRARIVQLRLGDEIVELAQYLTPRGRLIPRDSRSNDRWFQHIAIVTTDMDRAYARLREKKVRHASTGPQTLPEWNKNAAGIRAFYFHDPDDHVLEVIWFPSGKGEPRWQRQTALFAGIDHTAIVVADTERALAFYRDGLGMKVAGGSENFGTEQEHLNNVQGARLRITTLRAEKGPGVELLEYLTPRDGRPMPADARANDLLHWQTTILTDDLAGLLRYLRDRKFNLATALPVSLGESAIGLSEAAMVADSDGHTMILANPRK